MRGRPRTLSRTQAGFHLYLQPPMIPGSLRPLRARTSTIHVWIPFLGFAGLLQDAILGRLDDCAFVAIERPRYESPCRSGGPVSATGILGRSNEFGCSYANKHKIGMRGDTFYWSAAHARHELRGVRGVSILGIVFVHLSGIESALLGVLVPVLRSC